MTSSANPQDASADSSVSSNASSSQPRIRDYLLLEKLGQGGMGQVYKALHSRLGKTVALKLLPSASMEDPQAIARFEREMLAVGKLDHLNIVKAFDAGESHGIHFLVMEYVAGSDVAKIVEQ